MEFNSPDYARLVKRLEGEITKNKKLRNDFKKLNTEIAKEAMLIAEGYIDYHK